MYGSVFPPDIPAGDKVEHSPAIIQTMRAALLLLHFSLAFFGGCSDRSSSDVVVDHHSDAIRQFRAAQQLFKTTVATVRDEASYDKAAPRLEQVVKSFRQVAVIMKDLSPPAESARDNYRKMILDGSLRSEPTGEDMMSILAIESREKEVAVWMEAFVAAGQDAGAEMKRLYGRTD